MAAFELIDKVDPNKVNAAACALAEEHVRQVISCECNPHHDSGATWYDLRTGTAADVRRAVEFLDLIDGEAGDYVFSRSVAFPHLAKFEDRT